MLLLAPLAMSSLQEPIQLWWRTWGGIDEDRGYGVAVGSHVYIVGGTESFGAGGPPLWPGLDAFLACYDTDGNLLWNTTWGGTELDCASGVAVESNVYVVGTTTSFGAGGSDTFLACYDADGNQLWNTTWGGTESDTGKGVAVGSDIYIVGSTSSFGEGYYGDFLACYDVDGNELWNTTCGAGDGVAVGSNIYIVGQTGHNMTGDWDYDAFLACYDTDGNQLWNTTWGGTGWEGAHGVAVGSDKIYTVGETNSHGVGEMAAFLACYDIDGIQLWNTTWEGTGYDCGYGVAVESDNVYIVGEARPYWAGMRDAFIACYDVDGNQLWNDTWGGRTSDDGYGVAVGSDIYMVGRTDSYGVGGWDAFLVKYGFPLPHQPARMSDIKDLIFEASKNSVYFVSTGNTFDNSAMNKLYAYRERIQNVIPSVWSPDSGLYLDEDGRPLFDGHIVALGGRFANRMVKYYEDAGIAVVGKSWNGTHHLFTRIADGSTLYAVDGSTFKPLEKGYFVWQSYRDGDRYVFSEWGFREKGTYAGSVCFRDIWWDFQDYTGQYYIYSWTDLNNDDTPQENEFTLLASG